MRGRSLRVAGLVLFSWVLVLSHLTAAVTLTEGPTVESANGETIIHWKTDNVSGSRVQYGTKADALTQKADEGRAVGVEHRVVLSGLTPGTKYFFSVGTAKYAVGTGDFVAGAAGSGSTPTAKPRAEKTSAPATASSYSPPAKSAPPTRQIWGDLASLPDHFQRHGGDFHATSEDDYARKSWEFLQRAMTEGLPAKMDDADGTLRVWDPKTHTFAAYRRDHKARTFFKPESASYFDRQPGRKVDLRKGTP